MKIHRMQQNSEEWHEIKRGKMSGSDASVFLVVGKNGWGVGVTPYIYRKVAERITGETEFVRTNFAMERGTLLEPDAIEEYEKFTWCKVVRVGFVEMNDYAGCSPDGLVGADGMIEVKCPMQTEFVRFADTHEISKNHYAQMQFNMFICKRKWCDYVVFHPLFDPQLIIKRVEADEKVFERFAQAVQYFEEETIRLLEKI